MGRAKDSFNKDTTNNNHDQVISSHQRSIWTRLPHSFPFIAGLIIRTLFVHITTHYLLASMFPVDGNTIACTGISITQSIAFGV